MSDKEFPVNVTRGESLLMATLLKRLRQKKWQAAEAEAAADKMVKKICQIMPSLCMEIATDCGMAYGNGAKDEMLRSISDATFALAGVRIADELHETKMAEFN